MNLRSVSLATIVALAITVPPAAAYEQSLTGTVTRTDPGSGTLTLRSEAGATHDFYITRSTGGDLLSSLSSGDRAVVHWWSRTCQLATAVAPWDGSTMHATDARYRYPNHLRHTPGNPVGPAVVGTVTWVSPAGDTFLVRDGDTEHAFQADANTAWWTAGGGLTVGQEVRVNSVHQTPCGPLPATHLHRIRPDPPPPPPPPAPYTPREPMPRELPATGGPLPLVGLLGLGAAVLGFGLRRWRLGRGAARR